MRAIVGVTVSAVILLAACDDTDSAKDRTAPPPSTTAPGAVVPPPATSAPPASTASGAPSPAAPSQTRAAPQGRSTEAAIQRYEQYLHAVGREDLTTVCEIAGPAAKQAEREGAGPCTASFPITFQMISPAQKKALQTATVDPKLVSVRPPDKVHVPVGAVRATVRFSESGLGDITLQYLDNAWYIVA
ncbi:MULTISPECIES: hypothetical protein [unclassified Embleya]|uniref:hypothetical protein n=1 Tax=unclassified Embleya TaxID=2699296 RepID=UPI0033C7D474